METRSAQYFMQELARTRESAKEQFYVLESMYDMFVNDIASMINLGLATKTHPDVNNGLAMLFMHKDERKDDFFVSVIKTACQKFGQDRAPGMLYHFSEAVRRSNYYVQGMSGPKSAAAALSNAYAKAA